LSDRDSDFARISRFLRDADAGASTLVQRFAFGTAYFNDRLPMVWDRNFLLVESGSEPAEAAPLEAAAELQQGGAGLRHRKIVFEREETAARLAPALRASGWEARRLLVNVHRGAPPVGGEASEVDRATLEPAAAELIRAEPYGSEAVAMRQLLKADEALAVAVDQRCFAKLVDGKVVSYCRLYSNGDVAQVEDVATLPRSRAQGFARAVVSRAVAEAARSSELTFIVVVDGRWVARWYARLGFEEVGARYEFMLNR
jgi:ribosomal protein S18 acetylase RimI-like enzyme